MLPSSAAPLLQSHAMRARTRASSGIHTRTHTEREGDLPHCAHSQQHQKDKGKGEEPASNTDTHQEARREKQGLTLKSGKGRNMYSLMPRNEKKTKPTGTEEKGEGETEEGPEESASRSQTDSAAQNTCTERCMQTDVVPTGTRPRHQTQVHVSSCCGQCTREAKKREFPSIQRGKCAPRGARR